MKSQSIFIAFFALAIGAAGGYLVSHNLNSMTTSASSPPSTLNTMGFDTKKHIFRLMHKHRLPRPKDQTYTPPSGHDVFLDYILLADTTAPDTSPYNLLVINYPTADAAATDSVSVVSTSSPLSLAPTAASPTNDSIATALSITTITATAPTPGTTAPYINNWKVKLTSFYSQKGVIIGNDSANNKFSIPIDNVIFEKYIAGGGGQVPGVVFGVVNVELGGAALADDTTAAARRVVKPK